MFIGILAKGLIAACTAAGSYIIGTGVYDVGRALIYETTGKGEPLQMQESQKLAMQEQAAYEGTRRAIEEYFGDDRR